MNTQTREAFRFFVNNAGYCVGERAKGALALARAEQTAAQRGWVAEWAPDDDADYGDHEYWCSDARAESRGYGHCDGHEAEYCQLWQACPECGNRTNILLASLGGILEPSREYRRVVEAELALEAICNGL